MQSGDDPEVQKAVYESIKLQELQVIFLRILAKFIAEKERSRTKTKKRRR
jgi:hypothetical protein